MTTRWRFKSDYWLRCRAACGQDLLRCLALSDAQLEPWQYFRDPRVTQLQLTAGAFPQMLQPKKRVTRLLVPGLALPHGRQGCVGLGIACKCLLEILAQVHA